MRRNVVLRTHCNRSEMNTQRPFQLLALPLVLGLGAISSAPPTEKIDLTPRFEEGQSLVVSQSFTMDLALDQLSVMVDGAEIFGDGVGFDMEGEGEAVYSETVLEVRDGQIAKMHITVDEQTGSMTGEIDAMGNSETIDESLDSDMVGRTVEIIVDEDGGHEITDITEDSTSEAPELELNAMTHENHFESFLPKEPVEEGVAFTLGDDWIERAREMMDGDMGGTDELDADQIEMIRTMMDAFFEGTTVEATGKVTEVKDGIAMIDYEMGMVMAIDDLVSIVTQALPPEMGGQIPDGVEAAIEISIEMEGVGQFDLEAGQLIALEMTGDYEIIFSGSADVEGNSGSAEATLSGAMGMKATVDIE